jgi:hypothetical protein
MVVLLCAAGGALALANAAAGGGGGEKQHAAAATPAPKPRVNVVTLAELQSEGASINVHDPEHGLRALVCADIPRG